jgi:hypothetical protein
MMFFLPYSHNSGLKLLFLIATDEFLNKCFFFWQSLRFSILFFFLIATIEIFQLLFFLQQPLRFSIVAFLTATIEILSWYYFLKAISEILSCSFSCSIH